MQEKRICILGSTGSIGTQALDVIEKTDGLSVCGLAAGRQSKLLAQQAEQFNVGHLACGDPEFHRHVRSGKPTIHQGENALCDLIRASKPDMVLTAVVGAMGIQPTLTAIDVGATLAIANKETLVAAGSIVMPAARAAGVEILPVDSEHAGVFQCLTSGTAREIHRVTITSSGGALRDWSDQDALSATVEQALNHPNWDMGPKVTIDSATLMNKALEMIEAHWLFDLPSDKIDALIHPQSIIHAMVEYCDGSVIAQLAEPDMRLPIAYAMHYPNRPAYRPAPLKLADIARLDFRAPQGRSLRPIELARRVIDAGGAAGAILNAANETAVEYFIDGQCPFGAIVDTVETLVNTALASPLPSATLDDLLAADQWARTQAKEYLSRL